MPGGLLVFAYDFPHRKTQDVLLCLRAAGHDLAAVLAAPRVELSVAPSTIRTKVRGGWVVEPRDVARALGVDYRVIPHTGPDVEQVLQEIRPSLGVIAGARILSREVIARFSIGVINLHPGLVPEVRGLDSMLWAVWTDQPLGVTAHLIDERVDAGRVLLRRPIRVEPSDTLFDLAERLYGAQLEILPDAIERARSGSWEELGDVPASFGKMPPNAERDAVRLLPDYIARHANP